MFGLGNLFCVAALALSLPLFELRAPAPVQRTHRPIRP